MIGLQKEKEDDEYSIGMLLLLLLLPPSTPNHDYASSPLSDLSTRDRVLLFFSVYLFISFLYF